MRREISWALRTSAALWVAALAWGSQSGPINSKYPLEVYQMYQQRLLGSSKAAMVGSWSHWSRWSRCSRSCGGGVTMQSRECRYKEPRSEGRGKRRRTRRESVDSNSTLGPGDHKPTKSQCVGVYKRFHICNDQSCPGPAKDFRQLQCEKFNGKQFMGHIYFWEPFLDAPNSCELNCRAVGQRFYATLNQSVVDGTPCKGADPHGRWLCVSGLCKHVGCDGVVGSAKRLDACGVCGGSNNTCRLVSGLFTMPRLPEGYSLIAQLPRGACNITVAEMQPSSNYLALRRLDGQYIVNGNYAISWSGDYEAAGTVFTFRRQDAGGGETITAPGPLQEPVDIMLLYQQPNPGIKYEYMLPMKSDGSITPPIPRPAPGVGNSVIPPAFVLPGSKPLPEEQPAKEVPVQDWPHNRRSVSPSFPYGSGVLGTESRAPSQDDLHKPPPKSRGRKRKFTWKLVGYSECSKTCGGGMSASITVCVRESTQMTVPDKRCSHSEKPHPQLVRCNTKPCPAEWVPTEWGECSVTCGEGVQTRELVCKQEITATLTMKVADGACINPATHPRTQPCNQPPCAGPGLRPPTPHVGHSRWQVGDWGQCSMACGKGVQSRAVKCTGADGSEQDDCAQADRPAHEEPCNLEPCPDTSKHSPWMFTEWTQQCSEECGTGVQTRRVHCSGDTCDVDSMPDNSRACSSDKQCSGKWFSGPWGSCSPRCGLGHQTRDVVCVAFIRGQHRVALDMNCPITLKPATERACESAPCSPEWFFTDWTQCSRDCGTGVQKRDVRCLDEKRKPSTSCSEDEKPPGRRVCNTHDCSGAEKPGSLHAREEDDPTMINGAGDQALPDDAIDKDCVDAYPNCQLVVQARLCKYKYYRTYCCHSCHKKS